jgi:hypothetical protein
VCTVLILALLLLLLLLLLLPLLLLLLLLLQGSKQAVEALQRELTESAKVL